MNRPKLPSTDQRKTLLRLRMAMYRQEVRHETLVLTQPLRKVRQLQEHWRDELRNNSSQAWLAGGAVLLGLLATRKNGWRRLLRIALVAFPLLRRRPPRPASARQAANAAPGREQTAQDSAPPAFAARAPDSPQAHPDR